MNPILERDADGGCSVLSSEVLDRCAVKLSVVIREAYLRFTGTEPCGHSVRVDKAKYVFKKWEDHQGDEDFSYKLGLNNLDSDGGSMSFLDFEADGMPSLRIPIYMSADGDMVFILSDVVANAPELCEVISLIIDDALRGIIEVQPPDASDNFYVRFRVVSASMNGVMAKSFGARGFELNDGGYQKTLTVGEVRAQANELVDHLVGDGVSSDNFRSMPQYQLFCDQFPEYGGDFLSFVYFLDLIEILPQDSVNSDVMSRFLGFCANGGDSRKELFVKYNEFRVANPQFQPDHEMTVPVFISFVDMLGEEARMDLFGDFYIFRTVCLANPETFNFTREGFEIWLSASPQEESAPVEKKPRNRLMQWLGGLL